MGVNFPGYTHVPHHWRNCNQTTHHLPWWRSSISARWACQHCKQHLGRDRFGAGWYLSVGLHSRPGKRTVWRSISYWKRGILHCYARLPTGNRTFVPQSFRNWSHLTTENSVSSHLFSGSCCIQLKNVRWSKFEDQMGNDSLPIQRHP